MNSRPPTTARRGNFTRRWIFPTHHRAIAVQYFVLALTAVTLGTLLSLLMRIHRVWPDLALPFYGVMKPEDYLALVTMHGTLMVFFVLTVAPQSAFPNLVLAEQIGARQMAFPRLNTASFWLTVLSFLTLLAAFFVPAGAPISGWTSYPPFSAIAAAGPGQGAGMDLWLVSIAIFCAASVLGSVNFLSTILLERCPGMTWSQLPLTVWSWLVTSILTLLAFSVLLAAALLLISDRHFGTSFFVPAGDLVNQSIVGHGDGSPLLWLHLFWFFGHPEVYIAILPGMGLASSIFSNFTRRPVAGYKFMAAATVAIGMLGLAVWGHHMFVSGMNPYAGTAFALTTMAIAIPSTGEVLGWIGILWPGGLRLTTPMLFALGFLSFFIAGGVTGPLLAQPVLDSYLHNTFFVVAHFHLVMAMAGIFSVFAGVYYWFPLLTGRLMNEALGKLHFWISLVAAYLTFLPMHFTGLAGEPRHYAQLTGPSWSFTNLIPLETGITHSALLLAIAQLIFLANLAWSVRKGVLAPENPWQATTLEWSPSKNVRAYRGPYEYGLRQGKTDFTPQWEADPKQE